MFDETNTRLGKKRSQLPQLKSFVKLLEQRILFQFDQSESVSAVLKYYFYSRDTFPRQKDGGYLPEKSALHIEEILRIAHESGELRPDINIPESAKVITHAINGFVMEYYPRTPKGRERKQLAKTISALFYPALTGRNYPHDTKRKGGDYIL